MSADPMSDAAAAFEAVLQTPYEDPLPAEQELHATVRRYAEQGGDLDATDWFGQTLTAHASQRGLTSTVRLLADLRADVHKPRLDGVLPIHYSAAWGHVSTTQRGVASGVIRQPAPPDRH